MNDITITTKNMLDRLHKDTVGFDSFFRPFFEDTAYAFNPTGYPPYNIEKIDDHNYIVEIAVAGFSPAELEVEVDNGFLMVLGRKSEDDGQALAKNYVYRGISTRQFRRNWKLAEHTEVESANIENGLLKIKLVRKLPEALKPKKIAIGQVI
jgi:molecular chaperone IbpA